MATTVGRLQYCGLFGRGLPFENVHVKIGQKNTRIVLKSQNTECLGKYSYYWSQKIDMIMEKEIKIGTKTEWGQYQLSSLGTI